MKKQSNLQRLFEYAEKLTSYGISAVVLAFLSMSTMTGKSMTEKKKHYNKALSAMSNEAVEYVRGIPVVKNL